MSIFALPKKAPILVGLMNFLTQSKKQKDLQNYGKNC